MTRDKETTVTTTIEAITTFRIRDAWLGDLTRRFDALARRATKLGVPAPSFTVVRTDDVPEITVDELGASTPTGRTIRWHDVTVTGDAPKYDGWSMLAVIDRDLDEPDAPNVVDLLPGVELDPAWRDVGDICAHTSCNGAARGRKKLVVVEHESDIGLGAPSKRLIVGTTCLRDFLGHAAPERIAAWVETLSTLNDLLQSFADEEHEPGGASVEYRYDPVAVLARTAKVIGEQGWVSRGAARESGNFDATADVVLAEINWRPTKYDTVRPTSPTDEHVAAAEAALAWAVDLDPGNSDYLYNVQAVALKSGWRHRDIGVGASIVRAHDRELERIAEREREIVELTEPCFTGRGVITGRVLRTDIKDNGFQLRTVFTVLDDRGFKVWGTVPAAIDVVEAGQRVTFTATVEPKDETFGFFKRPTKAEVIA